MKKIIVVESPFASKDYAAQYANKQYALDAMRHVFEAGCIPIASHIFYTDCLNDSIPEQRELGISAGLELAGWADETWVFIDRGVSPGMQRGMKDAWDAGRKVIEVSLKEWSGK